MTDYKKMLHTEYSRFQGMCNHVMGKISESQKTTSLTDKPSKENSSKDKPTEQY
jgi:hypothetical protein